MFNGYVPSPYSDGDSMMCLNQIREMFKVLAKAIASLTGNLLQMLFPGRIFSDSWRSYQYDQWHQKPTFNGYDGSIFVAINFNRETNSKSQDSKDVISTIYWQYDSWYIEFKETTMTDMMTIIDCVFVVLVSSYGVFDNGW